MKSRKPVILSVVHLCHNPLDPDIPLSTDTKIKQTNAVDFMRFMSLLLLVLPLLPHSFPSGVRLRSLVGRSLLSLHLPTLALQVINLNPLYYISFLRRIFRLQYGSRNVRGDNGSKMTLIRSGPRAWTHSQPVSLCCPL